MIKAHLKNKMIASVLATVLLNTGRMIYLDNDLGRLITRPAEIAAYTAASLVVFFLFFYGFLAGNSAVFRKSRHKRY